MELIPFFASASYALPGYDHRVEGNAGGAEQKYYVIVCINRTVFPILVPSLLNELLL
jgi:hypothetical protein